MQFRKRGTPVLREMIERLTRDWVVRRRLPGDFGGAPIRVTPSAGLRYLFRPIVSVDPILLGLVGEFVQRGAVVWDVGANIGLFSFAAASRAGTGGLVVALEPDVWLVQLLRRSALEQPAGSAPVQVVPAAVASKLAIRTLCLASRSRAANHLSEYGTTQTGGWREQQSVVTVTLDWLLESLLAPHIVKIDVEGAELEVLQGAKRLFETVRPVLLCEVIPVNARGVTEFLKALDYDIFDGETAARARLPLSAAPWSTVAIPASTFSGHPRQRYAARSTEYSRRSS
jgi:FkbM family methyltransferase